MKDKVLKLRREGKKYSEISKILGISKSTISYHCGKGVKEKVAKRQHNVRKANKVELINYKGGKCEKCGYDKCVAALDFHHIDPSTKSFTVSLFRGKRSMERLKEEADKCILVCANCHREIHDSE